MIKTLVAAGCSLTKDFRQLTWPDYLAQHLNSALVNVAARGAGMTFVSRRLMMCLESYTSKDVLVAVMLPSSDRFDCYVDHNHELRQDFVAAASWQNGSNPSLVNLDGSLSTNHGYCLTGGQHRDVKKAWYKYYHNATAAWIDYWFAVINLQNYLRVRRFQYVFVTAYDLYQTVEQSSNMGYIEYDDMLNLVDFSRFAFYQHQRGFLSFARDHNHEFVEHYPVTQAHEHFVESVLLPRVRHADVF
jgi:hypothetical protein